MRLTVCYPRAVNSFPPNCNSWVYADDDTKTFAFLSDVFKDVLPLVPAADFQAFAEANQASFVAWCDDNLESVSLIERLQTPLDRNTSDSNLFLHILWARFISEIRDDEDKDLVVVTSSLGLARVFRQLSAERGWIFGLKGWHMFLANSYSNLIVAALTFIMHVIDMSLRIGIAGLILGKSHIKRLQGSQIFIESYLFSEDIGRDGLYRNRYFPGLVEWYERLGVQAAVYSILFRIRWRRLLTIYRRIAKSSNLIAPFELFLKYSDLIDGVVLCVRNSLKKFHLNNIRYGGLDVSHLVQEQKFRVAMRSVYPILLLKAPKRIFENGIRPKHFIDWYENQRIDKATCFGFKNLEVACVVIGARPYIPYSNSLSLFTTPGEIRAGFSPDVNWVSGGALVPIFRRFGDSTRYKVVPALRYQSLYSPILQGGKDSLLVLLTHSLPESLLILDLISDSTPHCIFKKFKSILIKPHPILNLRAIKSELKRKKSWIVADSRVKWTVDPVMKVLGDACLVLTAGSSAAVEAITQGLPVVLSGSKCGLDFFPLNGIDGRMWRIARDADEFCLAIDEMQNLNNFTESFIRKIAQNTLREFFISANDNMTSFSLEK